MSDGAARPRPLAAAPTAASHVQAGVQGKKIVVGVTGGIAAYKAIEVVRTLAYLGAEVHVIMTPSAQNFVGTQTFAAVSGNAVATEMFSGGPEVPHVELARGASLAVVAPATANTLAKLATGAADDLLTATLLMTRCPLVLAPAMHREMWEHEATAANVAILRARGAVIVGPESGPLLSGDHGAGRLVEPSELIEAALEALGRAQDLSGMRIIVTAGGTQEPIDPVRFIGNRSSGLMGFAVASAAAARGAKVTLIVGATATAPPLGIDVLEAKTAEDMLHSVRQLAPDADVIVKAAAVADFRPAHPHVAKLKKASGPPELELVPTIDILEELGKAAGVRKPGSILVGFAAETEADPKKLAELAVAKRAAKGADLVVANDVGSTDSGFEVRTNRAVIASADGVQDAGLVSKGALADALLNEVVRLLQRSQR